MYLPDMKWELQIREYAFGCHPFRLIAWIHSLFCSGLLGNRWSLTPFFMLYRLVQPIAQQLDGIATAVRFLPYKMAPHVNQVMLVSTTPTKASRLYFFFKGKFITTQASYNTFKHEEHKKKQMKRSYTKIDKCQSLFRIGDSHIELDRWRLHCF